MCPWGSDEGCGPQMDVGARLVAARNADSAGPGLSFRESPRHKRHRTREARGPLTGEALWAPDDVNIKTERMR